MVKLHGPAKPRAIVVKRENRARLPLRPVRCVVCGALLSSDHAAELVCDCHPRSGFNPRTIAPQELDERIAVLLIRAGGRPLVLTRALGCDDTETNRSAVRDSVRRLNGSGVIRVVTCGVSGRRLAQLWRAQRRKVGP